MIRNSLVIMLENKERKKERIFSKGLPKRLYLTYKCNDNCIFCYDGTSRKTAPDLLLKEAKKTIVKMRNEGKKTISLGGSEPTIYPHILELTDFIKNLGLKFRMASNLKRCSDKNFAKILTENGLYEVYTSLHGDTAELHDKITRVKGSFEARTQGIKNLIDPLSF